MKTIWKYDLPICDMQGIDMPRGAEILSVQMQGNQGAKLWVLVDPSKPKVNRTIIIHGTGHPVLQPENKKFIGTIQIDDGALVFHVFSLRDENINPCTTKEE